MKRTRRQFLQSTLGAPLAASLTGIGRSARFALPVLLPGPPAPGEEQFARPHFIRYDSHCFTINDRDTFIFSAAFHYPRCPRELWRDRLVKLQRAGFNTIETYVFWNYHERQEGRVDLGEFEDFVKLVGELGFWMIARPGPYVCAEWDAGGFPHWVIAKRFPLRSNHPESIRTSQHWFSEVLPVIERHLVTHSGPIILVQIENEYDYWTLGDAAKRDYLRALAHMAWDAGIDVPLITCWTKQVRERSDPDMARIADFCNFYPRWNIVKEVVPGLEKLRKEEPASPVGVVELQGGWFSEFGGKLSVNQDGVDAAQLNMLSKTVIEQGATFFSYYMGCGGSNFDWAAKTLTTTYDYVAPVREPGGLWAKYYAARGIGASLRLLGDVLVRAEQAQDLVQSSNNNVSVSERWSGKSGVVLVRENANAEQRHKMSFADPNSPTHRIISAPREGELVLGAREMKMLPVQIPITGGHLRYSTAEVLGHGDCGRPYVVVYDDPGRLVEISLATEEEPHVEGDVVYQYWDPEYESVVIGLRVDQAEKMLLFNGHLQIVVVPRERALRTWTARFPPTILPEGQPTDPHIEVPFITDCALMSDSGSRKNTAWADLDFAPGSHSVTVLLPPLPLKCYVNGLLTDFQYDKHWLTARVSVAAPPLPARPITVNQVETAVERFDPGSGDWLTTPARALEDLGAIPYGYVKYRAQFTYRGEPQMLISAFADDGKKVFMNSRLVPEASKPKRQVEFPLADYAHPGANMLEIAYELFGSPNFGDQIGELKGIESAARGQDAKTATPISSWQLQRSFAPMRGRDLAAYFPGGNWTAASLGLSAGPPETIPSFTWCRAHFTLEKLPEEWSVQWKVTFEADRDALLYLNGKFVGRYVTIGPQKDFYLPEPYLVFDAKRANLLTIVLAYCDDARPIRTLRIEPYAEFATWRARVEFEW